MKKPTLPPPIVSKKPQTFELHGDTRTDDYFWLREKHDPAVIKLLNDENKYTESYLSQHQPLMDSLFNEMKARIAEDDADVPAKNGDWFYYSRIQAGQEYSVHCRKFKSLDAPEEIILDENLLAEGKAYFSLDALEPSPDHQWLAYSVDIDGSERHQVHFKNLETGDYSPEVIIGAAASLEWSEQDRVVFYTLLDAQDRPDRVARHILGQSPDKDVTIYKESDPQLFVSVSKSRSRDYLFLESHGKVTSEVQFLP